MDTAIPPKQIDKQPQVRFRPVGEPPIGGYSLRVKVMDNIDLNPTQMVATKIVGFRQAYKNFSIIHKSQSRIYFTFVDGTNHLRYNFFQWFAVTGQPNATLEMSVAGRASDQAGLDALFQRFADNLIGK